MNPQWQQFLEASGARIATNDVTDFGDAAGELAACSSGTVIAPLAHLGLLEASGDEVKSFLHSQLTSDLNHLTADQAQHSAWCTAKGRMLASFVVWSEGDAYRLALAAELAEPILKRLQMFVLRAKVKLADLSPSTALLGLAGPRAEAALAAAGLPLPGSPLSTAAVADVRVIRLDHERFLICAPAAAAQSLWPRLATVARPVGVSPWRWLDIRAGLPLVTGATREEFVPQMADFEKIGGVSFHKGCYPGQEVVARTQYLGKVKRHLYRLVSATDLEAGDELHSPDNPDQACGKIVTGAPSPAGGFEALAVVQSNFAENVRLGGRDGPPVQATAINP